MSKGWILELHGRAVLRSGSGSGIGETLPLARKDAAWLAATTLRGALPAAELATALWPAADQRGALNNLRQRLHRLRRATGARLLEMDTRLALADDLHWAPPADPDVHQGSEPPLLLAGHVYDSEPEFAAWLARQRADRQAAWCATLAQAADAAEQAQALPEALRLAQRLLALEPLSEHTHQRLMRLHFLRGDRAAALATGDHCHQLLQAELGVAPSAATLALRAQIERQSLPVQAAAGPAPAVLLRPPQLIGRDDALAVLATAALAGGICVIVGEAGIGKTRLLQQHLAGRDDVLHLQARPGDAAAPYASMLRWAAALQRFGGGSGGGSGSGTAGEDAADEPGAAELLPRLPATLRQRLAQAQARGLRLIAADDLHYADAASLALLLALTQDDSALQWLLAHRPPAGVDHPLQALADTPRARRLLLQPLEPAQLQALVASLALPPFDAPQLTAQLWDRCGGNPLFALETLRAAWRAHSPGAPLLQLPRPLPLEHLLDERLQRLSAPALALARLAAVAWPDFGLALAQAVLQQSALALADAWHELETAQVMRGESFCHDLVRDAALRATPGVIAAALHRQVAMCLASTGIAPSRLALHWRAGGEAARAAQALAEAAALARSAGRPQEHAALLQQAADAWADAGDPAQALQARLDSVPPLLQAGALADAQALLDVMRDEAPPLQRGRVGAMRALCRHWAGAPAEAEQEALQALAAIDAAGVDDAEAGAMATSMLAVALALRGQVNEALALMAPWSQRLETVADPALRASFAGNHVNVLMQAGQHHQALQQAARHLQFAQAAADAGEQLTAHMNLSNLHGRRGDLGPALQHAEAAEGLVEESGRGAAVRQWNRITWAWWQAGLGRYGPALQALEAAIAALQDPGGAQLLALAQDHLVRLWIVLGQPGRAKALVDSQPPMPPGRLLARQLGTQALLAQALGRPDAALLAAAAAQVPDNDPVRLAAEIRLAAIDIADTPAAAAARLAALQQRAEAAEFLPLAVDAASWRAQALAQAGDAAPGVLPALLRHVEHELPRRQAPNVYPPAVLLRCHAAWTTLGAHADAQRCHQAAGHWLQTQALPQVPAPFVDSFLQRNPSNAQWRLLAARFQAVPP